MRVIVVGEAVICCQSPALLLVLPLIMLQKAVLLLQVTVCVILQMQKQTVRVHEAATRPEELGPGSAFVFAIDSRTQWPLAAGPLVRSPAQPPRLL